MIFFEEKSFFFLERNKDKNSLDRFPPKISQIFFFFAYEVCAFLTRLKFDFFSVSFQINSDCSAWRITDDKIQAQLINVQEKKNV